MFLKIWRKKIVENDKIFILPYKLEKKDIPGKYRYKCNLKFAKKSLANNVTTTTTSLAVAFLAPFCQFWLFFAFFGVFLQAQIVWWRTIEYWQIWGMTKFSHLTVKLTNIHTRKRLKDWKSHLEEKKELEVGGDLLKSKTEWRDCDEPSYVEQDSACYHLMVMMMVIITMIVIIIISISPEAHGSW